MRKAVSMLALLLLVFSCTTVSYAQDVPSIVSTGTIEVDVDDNNTVDAKFYATDLTNIKTLVTAGKKNVANALNNYKYYNAVATDATFTTLVNRINQLETITANKYYIDKTNYKYYVKINNKYYPCNANGVQSSTTAATVTAGNLVAFTAGNQNNITLGKALFVNKKLVLGNGADNRTNYNNGIKFADGRVNKNSASYAQGVTDADARSNPNSYNYKSGYNAGVVAADARSNPDSYNYKSGYNAGYNAGVAAADARVNKNSASYAKGVEDADNRSNPNSYNYKTGYNAGAASAQQTIINYFHGYEVLVNNTTIGSDVGAYMSATHYSHSATVATNIDPRIFSSIRVVGQMWCGSGTGRYPDAGFDTGAYMTFHLVDVTTGQTVLSKGVYGKPYDEVISLSGISNPVNVVWTVDAWTTAYGDATGQCYFEQLYATVR